MRKRTSLLLLWAVILLSCIPLTSRAAEQSEDFKAALISKESDTEIAFGDTVTVQVMLSAMREDVHQYSSYDFKIRYDKDRLALSSWETVYNDAKIAVTEDQIRVKGYGEDKNIAKPVVQLNFDVIKPGEAYVEFREGWVDLSSNAGKQNTPEVVIETDAKRVTFQIDGLAVDKEGEGIISTNVALPGQNFVFRLEDYNLYDYEWDVIIGGETVTSAVKVNKDTGELTIPQKEVDGEIKIIVHNRKPKTYTVKLTGSDVSGEKTATFNEDYVFRLGREKGYRYSVTVSIDGKEYTNYTMENDVYTIPGADITGDIKIKVKRSVDYSNKATVTFIGAGSKDGSGLKLTEKGVEYPFKIKRKKGYTYSVSVYVNGKKTPYEYDYELDTYYIMPENVHDEINIAIGKVPTVEVSEYITLDKESLFLVVYNGVVNEGNVPRYDGRSMYWSDRYDAYVWLVTSSASEKKVKKEAEEKILLCQGTAAGTIDYSGNVNLTLRTDLADVQLVREMYEGTHSLKFMEMQKLLNADVWSDRKVNIRDAVVILNSIS